jgi:hypothetical protein
MSASARSGIPSGLELLEESFHVVRRAAAGELLLFYAGTVPFVLDLLFYVADRTHAGAPAAGAAFGLAGLYLVMKLAQGRFARALRERLGATSAGERAPSGRAHALAQLESQPWSLIVLPLAAALGLPFGWAYAYYQSLAVTGDRAAARRQAAAWPRQNHALLSLLALLGLLAFLNAWVLVLALPDLLHTLIGWQGAAALHPLGMLSSTSVEVAAALAYLAVAPLARTAYALRCFYVDARTSGEDLRSELAAGRMTWAARAVLPVLVLALGGAAALGIGSRTAAAAPVGIESRAAGAPVGIESRGAGAPLGDGPTLVGTRWPARAPAIDEAARRVLARREFAWRLPQPAKPAKGLLGRLVAPLVEATTHAVSSLFDGVRSFLDWLARTLRLRSPPTPESPAGDFGWIGWTQFWFALAAIAVLVGAVFVVRRLRQRRRPPQPVVAAGGATLDVQTDEASAAALPVERWLETARRLLAHGDARGAVRAAYLAALALLAQRALLTPVRSKSNREYLLELRRRTRERPELGALFAEAIATFERVWYGRHAATAELAHGSLAVTARIAETSAAFAKPAEGAAHAR